MEDQVKARFLEFIRNKHLVRKGDRVLLAVSGGSDSMVLSDLFIHSGFLFGIAHCNFKLRGEDSGRDETFVKEYAAKHGIPFHGIRFDTREYAADKHFSIEEAARELRYNWFEKISREQGYHSIATAHHQNDNAETLLLNFFKGTGIRGLHGILPRRGNIIRPLLFLSKNEIEEYGKRNHIAYVEDATNFSAEYTRNFLRLQIIPELENRFPGFIQRMEGNIRRFSDAEMLYEQAVQFHRKNLLETRGSEVFIPVLKLAKSKPLRTIAYEIFKEYHFSYEQSRQILRLIDSEAGRVMQSATHRLLRDRKWFVISPLLSEEPSHILIDKGEKRVNVGSLTLTFSEKDTLQYKIPAAPNMAALDSKNIQYPLLLRKWKQGDYFYPLGLGKKKKLSRFFIDNKLSLLEKEKIWVLLSGQRILWVVGIRIDDRYKVSERTEKVLQIEAHLKN